jgi:hypothetical protein
MFASFKATAIALAVPPAPRIRAFLISPNSSIALINPRPSVL